MRFSLTQTIQGVQGLQLGHSGRAPGSLPVRVAAEGMRNCGCCAPVMTGKKNVYVIPTNLFKKFAGLLLRLPSPLEPPRVLMLLFLLQVVQRTHIGPLCELP